MVLSGCRTIIANSSIVGYSLWAKRACTGFSETTTSLEILLRNTWLFLYHTPQYCAIRQRAFSSYAHCYTVYLRCYNTTLTERILSSNYAWSLD